MNDLKSFIWWILWTFYGQIRDYMGSVSLWHGAYSLSPTTSPLHLLMSVRGALEHSERPIFSYRWRGFRQEKQAYPSLYALQKSSSGPIKKHASCHPCGCRYKVWKYETMYLSLQICVGIDLRTLIASEGIFIKKTIKTSTYRVAPELVLWTIYVYGTKAAKN